MLAILIPDETWRFYYFAGAQRIAMRTATSTTSNLVYFLGDHLGSTSLTVNPDGSKAAEMRYYPWGETRYTWNVTPTDYQYTGQRNEAGIGLYFYNARWYDAVLRRFVQPDTITPGGPQGLDRYSYIENNPVNGTDPTGHCPEDDEECRARLYATLPDGGSTGGDNPPPVALTGTTATPPATFTGTPTPSATPSPQLDDMPWAWTATSTITVTPTNNPPAGIYGPIGGMSAEDFDEWLGKFIFGGGWEYGVTLTGLFRAVVDYYDLTVGPDPTIGWNVTQPGDIVMPNTPHANDFISLAVTAAKNLVYPPIYLMLTMPNIEPPYNVPYPAHP